jgi:hypothetical protein
VSHADRSAQSPSVPGPGAVHLRLTDAPGWLRYLLAFLCAGALTVTVASAAHADTRIGEPGSGAGQLASEVGGVAVSGKEGGDLYVADAFNQRVDQFGPAGTFARAFGWGVRDGAAELQTCTTATGCQKGLAGAGPGQLNYGEQIAVDDDPTSSSYGDVYVVDQPNFRVEQYSPTGEFLLTFGGEVDKTTGADLCTAASHDECGAGVPGAAPGRFSAEEPAPEASWTKRGGNSIAVGPDGTVYVGDFGRIQEFSPAGNFVGQLELEDPTPQFVGALAVDSSGDIFERSAVFGNLGGEERVVSQIPGVREYSPAHVLLRTFDTEAAGSEPTHIAVDPEGDLFASDYSNGPISSECAPGGEPPFQGCPGEIFRAFRPDGDLYAEFTSDEAQVASSTADPRTPAGIAIGAQALYVTDRLPAPTHVAVVALPSAGPPAISDQHVDDVEPTTATVGGVVNPSEFETAYHFEYGPTSAYGTSAPPVAAVIGSLFHEYPVQAAISDLDPATLYHYRLVAESECEPTARPGHVCVVSGPDQTFETFPAATVRELTTQTVGPELVELKAQIDPNNSPTHYTICYGRAAGAYTEGCSEGALATGNQFRQITAVFGGLQPDTTYHYQLTATNTNGPGGRGEVQSADQAFTTEPSAAEERAAELRECPSVELREEDHSQALPDCRAYEQVSEVRKEGGEAQSTYSLSPSGERVLYGSEGVFAGTVQNQLIIPYLARRGAGGWATQAVISQRQTGVEPLFDTGEPLFSAELDRWVYREAPGFTNVEEAFEQAQSGYLSMGFADGTVALQASPTLTRLDGHGRTLSQTIDVFGQSADLSRLFLVTDSRLLAAPLDPRPSGNLQDRAGSDRIYELAGVGGADPVIRLIAELPADLATEFDQGRSGTGCSIDRQDSFQWNPPMEHLVSADGNTIFYSGPLALLAGALCGEGQPNPIAIFAHTGEATVRLNAAPPSQCGSPHPCATASPVSPLFDGASVDGSRAWFTTTQPLIDSDTDATADLYLAKLEDGEVTELVQASAGESSASHPTPGNGAGVQGVLRVSADGSHAAFVATGVLTTHPNALGQAAEQGADNLYVYDADSSETQFVARLCSGPELSGSVAEPACPADLDTGRGSTARNDTGLWAPGEAPPSTFTPDGRFLLLPAWGRLTPDDTDQATDIYRYDFRSGALQRLSVGRDGNDGDGNDDAYPAHLKASTRDLGANLDAEDDRRPISADGSTVVFETEAPLVSRDTNRADDVYEWEEAGRGGCNEAAGCIGLVSDGVDPHGAQAGIISSSGDDITFQTERGEVPADTDGVGDIYDARVDGGFPYAPPPSACAGAEACHATGAPTPSAPRITTESPTSGNGTPAIRCAKGKVRVKRHGQARCVAKKHHRKHKKKSHHKKKHAKAEKHHQRASHNRGGRK